VTNNRSIEIRTIWIVDDDKAILEAINTILEEAEYHTQTFSRGSNMRDELKRHRPSLILMDIWMVEENGKDISREIKSDKDTEDIPLILMSAIDHTETELKECKADGYIGKPFDIDTLINQVNSLI
jgi:DNA-binding response OmpR family regulator